VRLPDYAADTHFVDCCWTATTRDPALKSRPSVPNRVLRRTSCHARLSVGEISSAVRALSAVEKPASGVPVPLVDGLAATMVVFMVLVTIDDTSF
jgi:hypothetical protein